MKMSFLCDGMVSHDRGLIEERGKERVKGSKRKRMGMEKGKGTGNKRKKGRWVRRKGEGKDEGALGE